MYLKDSLDCKIQMPSFFFLLILRKDWCKQHIFKVKFEMEVYSPLWAKFINIIVVLM